MPTARQTGWRLRAGTFAAASVTSAYGIELLPLQSDQGFETPWTINVKASLPLTLSRTANYLDQSRRGDGGLQFKWVFDYMTLGMMSYWLTTFMGGTTFRSAVQYAAVTAMVYDQTDSAVFVNGLMLLPTTLEWQVGGWANVVWELQGGSIAL